MAGNYSALKQTIDSNIKQNGAQQITGPVLNYVLNAIVSSIGANATLTGIATPDTNPGTLDQNVVYLAITPGVYTNFNNLEIGSNEIALFDNSIGEWAKNTIYDGKKDMVLRSKDSLYNSTWQGTRIISNRTDGEGLIYPSAERQDNSELSVIRVDASAGDILYPFNIDRLSASWAAYAIVNKTTGQIIYSAPGGNDSTDITSPVVIDKDVYFYYTIKTENFDAGSGWRKYTYRNVQPTGYAPDFFSSRWADREPAVEIISNKGIDINGAEVDNNLLSIIKIEVRDGDRYFMRGMNHLSPLFTLYEVLDSNENLCYRGPGSRTDEILNHPIYVTEKGYIRYVVYTSDYNNGGGVFKITNCNLDYNPNGARSVLWLGTSIPEGQVNIQEYGTVSYPILVGKALGWNVINKSLGSSGIIVHSGVLGNGRDGKDLAESAAEKQTRYKDHIGDGTRGTVTQQRYNDMMDWGYDKMIIPYIDGTIASCDMIVFDHGYNDRDEIVEQLPLFGEANKSLILEDSQYDRSTYVGAFTFLLKKIFSVNPKIKIVICSYLEDQSTTDNIGNNITGQAGSEICEMQKKLAGVYNLPYIPMCDYNGMIMRLVPGTENYIEQYNQKHGTSYTIANYYSESNPNNCCSKFQLYCPDGIHPHTDVTGKGLLLISQTLMKLMASL